MLNPYRIHAVFKDDEFLVLIEGDELDPTVYRLRIARLIAIDDRADLGYWAAPSRAGAMQQAADFYAAEMDKDAKRMAELDATTEAERQGSEVN